MKESKFERVGTVSENLSPDNIPLGQTRNKLLCLKDYEKTDKIHIPQSGSGVLSSTNALYQNWGNFPYLFPPFYLLGKVLKLLHTQRTQKVLLIAPLWPGQPWFPTLIQMCIVHPVLLPQRNNLIVSNMGEAQRSTIKRCSDLHILDTKYMALGKDKIIFQLAEKTKNFKKKGQKPDPIIFKTSGGTLCPVSTIKSYIDRTKTWRDTDSKSKFFLSYNNPHKPIKSSSIGRWLKTVLSNVGVDVSKFTARSTRAASSSKMKKLGATTPEIMSCGNWNNSSTWQTFYNKPIVSSIEEAQKTMLK